MRDLALSKNVYFQVEQKVFYFLKIELSKV